MSKAENENVAAGAVVESKELNAVPTNMTDKDIKYREKYKQKVQEFEKLNLDAQTREKELSKKIEAASTEKNSLAQKLVSAKLEGAAIAAGILDADFVKLIDASKLSVNEAGEVVGLAEAITELKTNKPHCFGQPKKFSSSTNSTTVPATGEAKPKGAWDMTKEEFQRAAGISY